MNTKLDICALFTLTGTKLLNKNISV